MVNKENRFGEGEGGISVPTKITRGDPHINLDTRFYNHLHHVTTFTRFRMTLHIPMLISTVKPTLKKCRKKCRKKCLTATGPYYTTVFYSHKIQFLPKNNFVK